MDVTFETPFGRFEWDSEKAAANLRKHKIDFKDAVKVFASYNSSYSHDTSHSVNEDRFKITGMMGICIITVIFTDRNDATRIISARKATREEAYEAGIHD